MKIFLAAFLAFIGMAFATDCDFACTENYDPVCATNGMSFSNECVLQREACLAKTILTVAQKGTCPVFCPEMCTENYDPVCATNGKTFSNYCNLLKEVCHLSSSAQQAVAVKHLGSCASEAVPCPEMCPMIYQPVCASNKLTFSNLCMLEREACLTKATLTVAHQGECTADDTPAAPSCDEMCIEVYAPVCASNGKTFSNECFLQREACLAKTTLTVARQGACPDLSCPEMCTDSYDPVCASNGVTYSNYCELLRAACALGASPSFLSLSSQGPCAPVTDCPTACTKEYRPTCGTDGITYGNPCLLTLAACQTKVGITVAQDGPCSLPCPEVCTSQFSPVCGSNGRTYSNPCFLSKEACLLKATITTLHEGECAEADCPQFCTMDYQPVCGSDGTTYSSLCALNQKACLNKASITVVSQGECAAEPCPEICPLNYAPVCGSNWKTYPNECSLKAEACNLKTEITIRATTECETVGCNMRCSKELKPVCGSNGVTYGNECMLLLGSCEKRRSISKVHEGQCVAADCQMQCTQIYEPLCGTNHQTFSSLCHYDASNCQSLQAVNSVPIGIAHQGECSQLTEASPLSWEILREYDANDDGTISFEEYLPVASIVNPHASEKLHRRVFDAIDVNLDGVIDAEEAKEINSAAIDSNETPRSNGAGLAVAATLLALVVVAVVIAAVVIVRKRKSNKSFAILAETETVQETPYRPMDS